MLFAPGEVADTVSDVDIELGCANCAVVQQVGAATECVK
jgi:hypothetical protein